MSSQHGRQHPFDRRLLFVTGKGGVGKTTISVTIARALAAQGKRVLLTLTDDNADALLAAKLDDRIRNLSPNLQGVVIKPEKALVEYASLVLKSRMAANTLIDNQYSRHFLAAVPGLFQWAVLGKAWFHSQEEERGIPRYDTVIFDAPATGHTLEMLRVPKVIADVAPPGVLRRDAKQGWEALQDPEHTGLVLVTLAEELPVSESLQLLFEVRRMGLPITCVAANATRSALFSSAQLAQLKALPPSQHANLQALIETGRSRARLQVEQEEQISRLEREAGVSVRRFPLSLATLRGQNTDELVTHAQQYM